MTLHIFYHVPDDSFTRDRYPVYAYTDKKEIADEFIKQRNMKNFIYKKQKDVTKDELRLFEHANHSNKLSYASFYTSSPIFGKRTNVKVLSTWKEEESVIKNSDKLWCEYSKYLFDGRVFTEEYIKALCVILFIDFYGFFKVKEIQNADYFYNPYYTNFTSCEGLIREDFCGKFSYDDLKLFLHFFQDTFNNDKKEIWD